MKNCSLPAKEYAIANDKMKWEIKSVKEKKRWICLKWLQIKTTSLKLNWRYKQYTEWKQKHKEHTYFDTFVFSPLTTLFQEKKRRRRNYRTEWNSSFFFVLFSKLLSSPLFASENILFFFGSFMAWNCSLYIANVLSVPHLTICICRSFLSLFLMNVLH